MEVSRLGFLKGLASAFGAGALGGGMRLFAAPPGWQPPGNANLVFGVVSDTHLRTTADGKYSKKYWSDKWFVSGCNVSAAHAPKGGVTTVEFKREELPPGGGLAFRVTPRSCLGTSGAPLCENKKLDSIVL